MEEASEKEIVDEVCRFESLELSLESISIEQRTRALKRFKQGISNMLHTIKYVQLVINPLHHEQILNSFVSSISNISNSSPNHKCQICQNAVEGVLNKMWSFKPYKLLEKMDMGSISNKNRVC